MILCLFKDKNTKISVKKTRDKKKKDKSILIKKNIESPV
jgi:hypothetical protein